MDKNKALDIFQDMFVSNAEEFNNSGVLTLPVWKTVTIEKNTGTDKKPKLVKQTGKVSDFVGAIIEATGAVNDKETRVKFYTALEDKHKIAFSPKKHVFYFSRETSNGQKATVKANPFSF